MEPTDPRDPAQCDIAAPGPGDPELRDHAAQREPEAAGPRSLTVLYDRQCAFCRSCRDWLEGQATHLPVTFLAADDAEAVARYGEVPWLGLDLMVVGDRGETWIGPAAFVLCLWATVEYRPLAFTLSRRGTSFLAERVFATVSKQRGRLARYSERRACRDGRCASHPVPHPGAYPGPYVAMAAPPRMPVPPVGGWR